MFVKGWFKDNKSVGLSFLKELKTNHGLRELTSTPLLLALVCIGYRRKLNFSNQKSLIYLACIDALLIDWDSSRQIVRDSFVSEIDSETKKQILSKIACDSYCDGEYAFSSHNIEARLSQIDDDTTEDSGNGPKLLQEYELNHGLLVQRAFKIYTFSPFIGDIHVHVVRCLYSIQVQLNYGSDVSDILVQLNCWLISSVKSMRF